MYITYAELIARYDTMETWARSEAAVNSNLIYYAEHELNSRLASHFAVPFSGAHPTVKDLALDFTYWKALRTRDPDKAKQVGDDIMTRIADLKAGREYIYTGSGTTLAPSGANQEIWSNTMNYHPVRSMLEPEEEQVDEDRLDDEENERI